MTDQPEPEDKKIIVDEDWKNTVEAEKEAAGKAPPAAESAASEPSPQADPLPPPNLTFLASSLYLQGLFALGLLPGPEADKPQLHLEQAKHSVDMLQMLYEKTEGNRTPEETKELDTMLHELRLSYLAVQQKKE